MTDPFGRVVDYLRVSVTDRCNLRCTYCMSAQMDFLPKRDLLSLEEIDRLCGVFVQRGVRHLRLTGGEPLVRRGIVGLVSNLSRHLKSGALDELTMTTNGVRLREYASGLAAAGIKRINVSLDTLDRATFSRIARGDSLYQVLDGISAAQDAGIRVKINTVALKRDNAAEIPRLVQWAHERDMDLTLIETMPLGAVDVDRTDQYLPLSEMRARLEQEFTLVDDDHYTGGPARYYRIAETNGRLGLITPLTHNFCNTCNRVRLTATGELYLCLGQNDKVNLRDALRTGGQEALDAMLDTAMRIKPKGHDFVIDGTRSGPAVERFMSATGG